MANLKIAFRTLAQAPFMTAVAILSLALGIGANAAIFSLFDQILLQNLPVQAAGELVNLSAPGPKPGSQSCNQAGDCDVVFSYLMFRDLEAAQTGFSGIAAHRLLGASMARDGLTISGEAMAVSGSYFPVLGLRPALGRLLGPGDDQNIGEHSVAVLSHGYWETHLGLEPGVLNGTLIINGQPFTIVGVAPRGFTGTTLGASPDVFVPLTSYGLLAQWFDGFDERTNYWAYVFARLQPETPLERARQELNTVYQRIVNEVEAPLQEGMSEATLERFRTKELLAEAGGRGQSQVHGEAATPLTLLMAITGIVLLIACANIANLMLARGATRSAEMAIRGSLGASRRQLLGQLLTESVLLAFLGGVASLLVAWWTLRVLGTILPPEATATVSLTLRPSVVLFSAALALLTGLIFGLYPALQATRSDLINVLRSSSGQPSGSRGAARFRTGLVVAQLALSMALLVGAGLFVKSLVNISRVDLGLNSADIATFRIAPELSGYEAAESMALFARTEERLAALPGVSGVTASLVPILSGSNWGNDVQVEGFESGPDIDSNSRFNTIAPSYFSTLGIPLLAGREFLISDDADAPAVAIVNEAFAEKFGLDPRQTVGKRMSRGGDELDIEIVGIVQNAKYSDVKQVVPPLFFVPYRQFGFSGWLSFYVRSAGDADPVLRAIPAAIKELAPNMPVEDLKTLETQVLESVALDRMISTLSAAFAVLATVLAAVGLYGVLAYTVAQRTREFGLRMALGADGRNVRRMVLRQMGVMTLVGGLVGIGGALLLGRAASSLLFELDGSDPVVLSVTAALLVVVALAAGYLPARRASKVDPMTALRFD
jgi:predicted permease